MNNLSIMRRFTVNHLYKYFPFVVDQYSVGVKHVFVNGVQC